MLDEDSSSIQKWSNDWGQTANNIRVIARDMIGLTGFDDLSQAGDGVYLYDASGTLIESAAFASGNTGNSVEFSNGTPSQSVAGVNGAYTSSDGDVGSPGDLTPVYVTVPTYSISQVRSVDANGVADSLNTYCKLSGTVTSIDFDGNSGYSFYMTDGTQGINVYRSSDLSNYTSPAMGDNIEVTGTIAQFRGLLEIIPDSLSLISQNNAVPPPMIVTTLDESTESELITFENVTLVDTADWPKSATSRNIDFVTSAGDTLTMRIDYDAAIFGNTPVGSFDLTGIGAQYDASSPYLEGYQIFPRGSADIYTGPVIPSYSIAQVRGVDSLGVTDSIGVYCKLSGTVTSIDFDGNSGYNFYMTDGTRGIYVYRSSDLSNYTAPSMGDEIRIVGSIGQFRGLTQMNPDSIALLSQGNTLPAPTIVTTLDESTEGELITFKNVYLVDTTDWPSSATSKNIDFYTTGGDTLAMRIDYDAAIFGNTPTGSFDLTGMGGQYDFSSPYLDGYQILPRGSSDIAINAIACSDMIDSVQTINVAQGVYRVHLNGPMPAATNYTVEWKPDTAATWRSKSFKNAAQPYLNINVTPWFNNSIVARVGVDDGTSVSYSCEETFTTPCRPMTLQTAQQNAAKCGGDSALVRVGYAGGRGAKSILWSNGATTKRTYAQQGQTLTVTVTDATGCSLTESITASVLANTSTAPTNVSTTRSGTVVTVNWTASTFGAGQTLIGYRVQYRLRGTTTWSQTALTTNTTADVDFAGGTPGNYEFTVIARYKDNGTGTTSARACFTVRGVPTTKRGTASGMDNGSAIAIYPNPAHHQVYVAAASGSEVMLMDLGGRILAVQTVDQAELAFDLSGMANGVYMIQIQSKGEVITERVVKQ